MTKTKTMPAAAVEHQALMRAVLDAFNQLTEEGTRDTVQRAYDAAIEIFTEAEAPATSMQLLCALALAVEAGADGVPLELIVQRVGAIASMVITGAAFGDASGQG